MLLVRASLGQTEVDLNDLCSDTEEYVGVTVELKGRPVTFVSAYVRPQGRCDPKTIVDICTQIKGEAVIAGDFNSHNETWGDKKTDARGRALQSTLDGLALRNITSGEQTFVRPGEEGSVIDLTFITRGLRLTDRPEKDSRGSDHLPIIIGKPPKVSLKTCHLVDWKEYRGQLDKLVDSGAPLALENIAEALKKTTRMVQIPITRPNPDMHWLRLRAQRRRAQRRSWRTNKPEDIQEYKRLDAKFRRHGKKLAKRHRRKKSMADGENACRTSAPKTANTWSGPSERSDSAAGDRTTRTPLHKAPPDWSTRRDPSAPSMKAMDAPFTLHELRHAIDACPRKRSSPGPDGVTNQAIRNLDESCHDSLLDYMNKVWSNALSDCFSGFRRHRSTAVSVADLTTTMEEAKERGWSTATVFLDVTKAFNALPHDTIFTALQNLRITGRPLSYIRAFLTERTLRVLGARSRFLVNMAVYADDAALWATSPPNCRQEMVKEFQRALTNTVHRLHELGLDISAEKTTALPAVDAVLQKMRTRTNTLRALGGTTWGTSQAMMLAMYKGLVVSCPTYALPLVTLNSTQQENLEKAQRVALRICLGTPRSASSHKTLVEAGVATICATLQKRTLGHLIRMKNGRSTGSLIMKIAQRTESGLGRALCQLGDIAGTAAAQADLPPLQERPQPMDFDLHIPGLRSRRTATAVTLRTLALSHIEDQYHGWAQVFTDGSVRPTDGSSTAAAAFEAAGVGLSARLTHHATCTTTELAAILLALKAVQKGSTRVGKWVILCDSQAALSMLDNLERAPPLARRIAAEAMALEQLGHQFRRKDGTRRPPGPPTSTHEQGNGGCLPPTSDGQRPHPRMDKQDESL
ncbi:hypothetical protein HPB47_025483 [Ixodes persulcatus]|uniref:Uncharacterized protein n=1 Tax=Ixodes persulcatus TaxID=34615 RepID=A0AC60Q379_IXOPE|nr:hypothetical protein HPB47_025483 [Ixodes persulcatus]